ncbi:uncharacterized protein LOC115455708 [Manduca sexta]|uniref:uncharacterized protein LOC115455708 n=1 Tax=Manduca sexta TaxID=7130 RepID=UPI00188E91AB|nr:uncharacterized protein LOC115455708 [Manduca sexta]
MPPGRSKVLRHQARKMVYDVLTFMKKEAEDGPQFDLKAVQKRTAAATGVSERTVRRIATLAVNDPFNPESSTGSVFRTPGKKRVGRRNITGLDCFNRGIIKRLIQNFHNTGNGLPTIKNLLKKLKEEKVFKGSPTSLRRIIKDLGFKWRKTDDNKKLILEDVYTRYKRIDYLRKITKYREEGRPIVYTDEFSIDSSKSTSDSSTPGLRGSLSKPQRIIIVHAASDAGFICNALLIFKAGTKLGDLHTKMNYEAYETWIRTQLLPNLPVKSVVVLDNAPYHNKAEDGAPTSNAKRSVMEAWLQRNNITFNATMLKPDLYKLISINKGKNKKYNIDKILNEHNHTVLRIPPYHPDLNPLEIAWGAIQEYVSKKDVPWTIANVIQLVEERIKVMDGLEWLALCNKVRSIEAEYKKIDEIIDKLTDAHTVRVSDDESETEDDDSDSEELEESSSEEELDLSSFFMDGDLFFDI